MQGKKIVNNTREAKRILNMDKSLSLKSAGNSSWKKSIKLIEAIGILK